MDKILQFKPKPPSRENEIVKFMSELEYLKALYLKGEIDTIVIVAQGWDLKCCTSNNIPIKRAKEVCNDFINNVKEYVD